MGLALSAIAAAVDKIAPFRLAYDWDNVGLQIGDPAQNVDRLLIALEINAEVIRHAQKKSCQAILTHHPLIFHPPKSLRADDPAGKLQIELVRAGIGLIVAHTNLDRVLHGTNGILAGRIGLRNVRILEPAPLTRYKFVVFVPRERTPDIIDAISRGGGGRIGNYSCCSFRSPGIGTFVPEIGADPFVGETGRFEQAEEDRLESVVPAHALKNVIHEVKQAHPYEEVAYDVYPLFDADPAYGLGVSGELPKRSTLRELAALLAQQCDSQQVCIAGKPARAVKNAAIITGSAGNSIRSVNTTIADVVVTGELNYHNTLEAQDRGLSVITVGHAASEKIFASDFARQLMSEESIAASGLEIAPYENFADPLIPLTGAQDREPRKRKNKPVPRTKS